MLFFVLSFIRGEDAPGIFSKVYHDKIIIIDASGSSNQEINGTSQRTKPEYAIYPWKKTYDWCSNCCRSYDEHPWITFSIQNRKIKLNGYFVRCGCCYDNFCCCDEGYCCYHCCLYSWSLQISDDNMTWTEVHRIDRNREMRRCAEKTFKLDKEYITKYVRIIQNEPCPGDPPCIALNKIELFGDVISDGAMNDDFVSFHDDDDDVSIIGHISKNGRVITN